MRELEREEIELATYSEILFEDLIRTMVRKEAAL